MGDAVAAAVLAQFAALPKTGKPQPHEHTVLAGIALSLPVASAAGDSSSGDTRQAAQPAGTQQQPREPTPHQPGVERELVVVAIATGTKCLGASKRLPGGVALNDCHAEALCRRALLRWLYTEMREVVDKYSQAVQAVHQAAQQATNSSAGGSSRADTAMGLKGLAGAASTRVLRLMPPKDGIGRAGALHSSGGSSDSNVEGTEPNDGRGTSSLCGGWRFELQPGVQLHMYVSQPPCGDASILGPMPGLAQPAAQVADGEGGCLACRCPSVVALAAAAIGDAAGSSRRAAGSSGPGAGSFGRTGAKPLKRQRMEGLDSGPQHAPASSAASAVASGACQQPSAEQQHLLQHPQHPQQQPAEVAAPEEVVHFQLPQQHEVESYGEEQATGVVRRKPGRGDATLSMSCSDKLARWCLLGLQGSLLSGLLASPLHLASLTVSVPPTTTACPAATAPEAAPGAAADAAEAGAPAAVAIQPPPVKQQQQATGQEAAAPPGSTAAQLAAAAEAALRRALLGRTEQLARERLVGAGWPGAAEGPSLPIHLPHEEAAGDGFAAALAHTPSTAAAAAAAAAAAEAPIAAAVAAATPLAHAAAPLLLTGGGSGNVSSGGASSSSAATVGQMQELGLTPSATRRVGGGSSVVWVAPPSGSFKWKQHKQRQRQQQQQQRQQQQRQQQQQLAAPAQQQAASVLQQPAPQQSASPAAALPPPVPTLLGGSVEAVAGSTGLKAGSAKTKLGQPVHPSAQASVCKAALFAAWQQLGTSLCSLPVPAPAPAECAGGAGAGAALAAAVQGSGPAEASAVAAAAAAAAGAAGLTYREAKQRAGAAYGAAWRRLLQPPSPLEGWIPKPASLEDFSLRT